MSPPLVAAAIARGKDFLVLKGNMASSQSK